MTCAALDAICNPTAPVVGRVVPERMSCRVTDRLDHDNKVHLVLGNVDWRRRLRRQLVRDGHDAVGISGVDHGIAQRTARRPPLGAAEAGMMVRGR